MHLPRLPLADAPDSASCSDYADSLRTFAVGYRAHDDEARRPAVKTEYNDGNGARITLPGMPSAPARPASGVFRRGAGRGAGVRVREAGTRRSGPASTGSSGRRRFSWRGCKSAEF
jgi:hypothetical protein